MAKYEVISKDGSFNASFSGSLTDLFTEACCIVLGMYGHMRRTDGTGFVAEMFRNFIESGDFFDKYDDGMNEQYKEFDVCEDAGDVQ